ncbi:MAG: phage integrase N-terminal SAM-like domain-containing protein [Cyanobacteria bacterium J06629_9]
MSREVPEPRFIEIGLPPRPVVAEPKDLTWQRVTEFLRSRELAANTHKTYERNLQQFYTWLEQKPWREVTHRDIDRYKQYLKALPSKRGGTLSPCNYQPVPGYSQKLLQVAGRQGLHQQESNRHCRAAQGTTQAAR